MAACVTSLAEGLDAEKIWSVLTLPLSCLNCPSIYCEMPLSLHVTSNSNCVSCIPDHTVIDTFVKQKTWNLSLYSLFPVWDGWTWFDMWRCQFVQETAAVWEPCCSFRSCSSHIASSSGKEMRQPVKDTETYFSSRSVLFNVNVGEASYFIDYL